MSKLKRHVFLATDAQTDTLELLCVRLGCDKQSLMRIALERLATTLKIEFPRDEPKNGGNRRSK